MNSIFIKKAAKIVGFGIIVLSIVIFVFYLLYALFLIPDYYNDFGSQNHFIQMFPVIIVPFSSLISGFGFGGIILMLGELIKTDDIEPAVDELVDEAQESEEV